MKTAKSAYVREEVRESILDAADRLFPRYGYKKTTMDDLAQEAGIGKGTIYLYFTSKEEVALSCVERLQAHIREQLSAIAHSDDTVVERLRRMLVARVVLKAESVRSLTHTYDEVIAALRSAVREHRARLIEADAQMFAAVLLQGKHLGVFAVEDAYQIAHTLLQATNALMPSCLTAEEVQDLETLRMRALRLADLLLYGLLSRTDSENPKEPQEKTQI